MGFLDVFEDCTVDVVIVGDADLRGESGGVAESLRSVSVSEPLEDITGDEVMGVVM